MENKSINQQPSTPFVPMVGIMMLFGTIIMIIIKIMTWTQINYLAVPDYVISLVTLNTMDWALLFGALVLSIILINIGGKEA